MQVFKKVSLLLKCFQIIACRFTLNLVFYIEFDIHENVQKASFLTDDYEKKSSFFIENNTFLYNIEIKKSILLA